MIITVVIAVMTVGLLGALTMIALSVLGQRGIVSERLRISVIEFTVAFLVASLVVTPGTWKIGKGLSVNAVLNDKEWYNGVELPPEVHTQQCKAGHRDDQFLGGLFTTADSTDANNAESDARSNCRWTFTSETYKFNYKDCTGTGKDKHCTSGTRWIDVKTPYATTEYTYSVSDTLGQKYDYPDVYIAADAKSYSGRAIPANIPRGAPADWLDAKQHRDAGDPRPTTKEFTYQNPILALKAQTGIDNYDRPPPDSVVQGYVSKGLIPDHTANILKNPIKGGSNGHAQTTADKAGFVCVTMSDADKAAWQAKLMQFNAQLGTHLQGDLHLLIVGNCINDLHEYTKSSKAYWQGPHFGHSPLSKNGVIVVLQTYDGKTIAGADATTGMPFGNNGMLNSIRTYLPGTSLTPRDVLGDPHTIVSADGKTKRYTNGSPQGSLEGIVLTGQYQFQRICMIKCPPGEKGYGDLVKQLEPSVRAKVWMVIVIDVISIIFWLIVAKTNFLDAIWERLWDRLLGHRRRKYDDYDEQPQHRTRSDRYTTRL